MANAWAAMRRLFVCLAAVLFATLINCNTASAACEKSAVVNPKFLEARAVYNQIPRDRIDNALAQQWNDVAQRQQQLMSQAAQVDAACAQMDSQSSAYESRLNNFESQCSGTVPQNVYDWCMSQKPGLVNERQQVQSNINAFNAMVNPYNASVGSWLGDLDRFIAAVKEKTGTGAALAKIRALVAQLPPIPAEQ
jgi:hypothetical protein